MGSNWCQKYDELKEYIVIHPTIKIKPNVMVIPNEVRSEFNNLLNIVKTEYIKEAYPSLLTKATILSTKYAEVRKETLSRLSLEAIEVNPNLDWFLRDPLNGLTRKLFDPLFDLLQGKIDVGGFELLASKILKDSARNFMHRGYLNWVTLSLISLMAADEAYYVPAPEGSIDPDLVPVDSHPGEYWQKIPDLVELKKLSLDVIENTLLLVPQVILHSDRLKVFVSMRTDFQDVYFKAYKLFDNITSMEWYRTEDILAKYGGAHLWPDIVIYLNGAGKELRVVADYLYIARPDIVINVMENSDGYESGGMEIVKHHNAILKPRLGSFVIYCEPIPQTVMKELEPNQQPQEITIASKEGIGHSAGQRIVDLNKLSAGINKSPFNIHFLDAGYDVCKLEPIIDAMAGLIAIE